MTALRVSNSTPVNRSQPNTSPNAILDKLQTTGANGTAALDGLPPGHASSVKMALHDLPALKKYKADIEAVAKETGFPPALLAGIISRETRGGTLLDSNGRGDNGHGYGLMQVDSGTAAGVGGPYSRDNIRQGAQILKGKLDEVKRAHPDWSPEWQLRGAVAAYNFGAGNVHSKAGIDQGTYKDDYSADVWSRSQALAPHFGGASTAAPTGSASTPAASRNTTDGMDQVSAQPLSKLGAALPAASSLIARGAKGEDVASLQKALNAAGANPKLDEDGDFGPKTEQALKSLQSKLGVPSDGIYGPQTAEKMGRGASGVSVAQLSGAAQMKEVKPGSKGPEVVALKQALKEAGFYKGVINDQMGPDGVKALKEAKEKLKLGGAPDVAGAFTLQKIKDAAQAKATAQSAGGASSGTAQINMKPVAQVHATDCGITSASMIINKLTGKNTTSPGLQSQYGFSLVAAMEQNGVTVKDHGNLRQGINSEDQAFNIFKNALDKGNPILFGANNSYGGTHWSGGAGHYMVATGVSTENGQRMLTFNDPNGGVERKVPFSHLWNAGLRHDGNCVLECSR
jgi:peptidoglycan hydrolase-like protein with peptidoglycan-binding domain